MNFMIFLTVLENTLILSVHVYNVQTFIAFVYTNTYLSLNGNFTNTFLNMLKVTQVMS